MLGNSLCSSEKNGTMMWFPAGTSDWKTMYKEDANFERTF